MNCHLSQYELDVSLITETHWPGSEIQVLENGALILKSGKPGGIRRQGIGSQVLSFYFSADILIALSVVDRICMGGGLYRLRTMYPRLPVKTET